MKNIYRISGLLIILLMMTFFQCCHPSTTPSEYVVTYKQPTNSDLALTSKTVGIDITAPEGYHTTQILLTSWFAGFNNGSPSQIFPVDFHGSFTFSRRLPDAEQLDMCEGMYYFFTLTYTAPSIDNGVSLGTIQLIQPATKRRSNNTIEQAQCTSVPGPSVSN